MTSEECNYFLLSIQIGKHLVQVPVDRLWIPAIVSFLSFLFFPFRADPSSNDLKVLLLDR